MKESTAPNTRLQATWPRLRERTPNCDCSFPAKMVTTTRKWPCALASSRWAHKQITTIIRNNHKEWNNGYDRNQEMHNLRISS
jgi:hypothetical protein